MEIAYTIGTILRWSRDLHTYLRAWKRWSWLPPWRCYMARVRQPMKPSARRITRWMVWIIAAELAAFLPVFTVFIIEQ